MKSIYTGKIEEESLAQYLPQVNMSDRDKALIKRYLAGNITYRDLGKQYGITGERVRQLVEKFARKAHHIYVKELDAKGMLIDSSSVKQGEN